MGAALCRRLVSKDGHDGHERLDEDNEAYFAQVEKRNKVRFTDDTPTRHQQGQGITSIDSGSADTNKLSGNTVRHFADLLKHAEDDALLRQSAGLSVLPTLSNNKPYNLSSTGSVLTPSNASISSALSAKSSISASRSKRSTAYSPLRPLPAPTHDTKSINSSNYSVGSAKSMDVSSISSYRTGKIPRKIIVDSDSEFMQQYVHFDDDNKTVLTMETGGNNTLNSLSVQHKQTSWSEGMIFLNIARPSKVTALAWDNRPGPSILAVGCEDGSVILVHVEEYHHQGATSPTIGSPASKSSYRSLSTKSSRNGESTNTAVRRLPPRDGKVRSMSFSPRNHHLAIGGEDCTMVILNLGHNSDNHLPNSTPTNDDDMFSMNSNQSTQDIIVGEIEREDRIHAVEYSPSGLYIAVAGFDGICAIVNASTLELVTEISRPGLILCVAWHPSGHMIAVGGSDKEAAVIDSDSKNWEVLGEIQRHGTIQCLRWSPVTTTTTAAATNQRQEEGQQLASNSTEKEGYLAVGGSDGKVAIIDMDTKSIAKEISLVQLQNQREALHRSRRRKRTDSNPQASVMSTSQDTKSCRVNSVCWSPDGSYISICGSNGMVIIVETNSFAIVQEVNRNSNLTCIAWQPINGKYLAVGGDDHNVAVLKTGGGIVDDHLQSPKQYLNKNNIQSTTIQTADSIRSPSGWVLDESFDDAADELINHNTTPFQH